MSTLPSLNFSDLEHGVGVLEEVRADPEQVRAICTRLLADVEGLTGNAADEFRRVVWGCILFGDRIEQVRPVFAALAIECAGATTAQVLRQQEHQQAREHGKRGGRPCSEYDDDWLRLYQAKKARRPELSKRSICKLIADEWMDESNRPRAFRTIEDGVNRALKKVHGKPRFPR